MNNWEFIPSGRTEKPSSSIAIKLQLARSFRARSRISNFHKLIYAVINWFSESTFQMRIQYFALEVSRNSIAERVSSYSLNKKVNNIT
jgi:hypothetical protein